MFFRTLGFQLPHFLMEKSADNAEGGEADTDADKGDVDEDKKSGSDKTETDKKSDSPQEKDNSDATLKALTALTGLLSSMKSTANKDAKARRQESEKILAALTSNKPEGDEDPSELATAQGALQTSTDLLVASQKTLKLEREAVKLNFASAEEAAKLALLLHSDKVVIADEDGKQTINGAKEALEAVIETYPAMLRGSKKPIIDEDGKEINSSNSVERETQIRAKYL